MYNVNKIIIIFPAHVNNNYYLCSRNNNNNSNNNNNYEKVFSKSQTKQVPQRYRGSFIVYP